MSITLEKKRELIEQYANSENDTGSVEVQCGILTHRIKALTQHYKDNHKDHSSERGLRILVGRRKALLSYLKKKNIDRYLSLIEKLGLRK